MGEDEEVTATSVKQRNIISPWRNIAEFRDIYEWIYNETSNNTTWQRAVQELRVWINRRRAQCPAAVYATHAMLEVKLTDNCNNLDTDELRSLYAFALVRFFNFMSSTMQTHNMRSMYTTAIELGLESFVVDIRHICAHGTDLPELSILRQTADYCLNWLRDYYWRAQSDKMIDADATCLKKRDKILQKCAKQFRQLFELYDIVLECHLNRWETMKEIKQNIRGRQLAALKEFWKSKNLKTIREAFDLIVLDMVAIIKSGVGRKHLPAIIAREFVRMKYFFAVVETHNTGIELEELIEVVQNLFRFLAVYNVIETVLQRLFEIAETPAELSQKERSGASFWAKHIVEGFATFIRCRKMFNVSFDEDSKTKFVHTALNFGDFSKNVRQTYVYSGVNIKRSIIFGDSFQRPWVWHFSRAYLEKRVKAINNHTAPILPSLCALVKPKMSDDEISQLKTLIEVYLDKSTEESNKVNGTDKNQDVPAQEKIYTLRDVLSDKADAFEKMDHCTGSDIEQTDENGWTSIKNDGYDWSKCPIGRLPWN